MKILLKETRPTTRRSKKEKTTKLSWVLAPKSALKFTLSFLLRTIVTFSLIRWDQEVFIVHFSAKIQIVKVLFKRTEAAFLPTIKKI